LLNVKVWKNKNSVYKMLGGGGGMMMMMMMMNTKYAICSAMQLLLNKITFEKHSKLHS